jgi:hypothetical protein
MAAGKKRQVATRLSPEKYNRFLEIKAHMLTSKRKDLTNEEVLEEALDYYYDQEIEQKKLKKASDLVTP